MDTPTKKDISWDKTSPPIDARTQSLFKILVEDYLTHGTPIGSKHIADRSFFRISSATVRNIMASLEDKGLVASPHTSAGKVPTEQGLRFFVDSLISVEPLDRSIVANLSKSLREDLSPKELVETASKILADLTCFVGLVTTPRPEQIELRQIQFLPLTQHKVLAIIVVNEREVQNRVVKTERNYTNIELNEVANYLNQEFSGHSLLAIRQQLLDSMRKDQQEMNRLMQIALDVAAKSFAQESEHDHDYVFHGERNLLGLLSSSEEVQVLLDAFRSKSSMVDLLDRCMASEGVQLFIGSESGYEPLGGYSLISAKYEVEGSIAGAMGVIGPTRMPYQKVIPLVDTAARLLGNALDQSHS
ncbi:MAG: heat-inducible transcriptional repressor HrcA [Gammaproteobacteria bacterium]|nr:heat-inducible transcriptional repressor HrcA [Gammaproteobacteria bacterium]